MAGSDFDIRLKKEARTSLQMFRDQSLLRRKFGEDAVKLYNLLDSSRPASELMAQVGMPEEKFVRILEFMNNNAMVSVVSSETGRPAAPPLPAGGAAAAPSGQPPPDSGQPSSPQPGAAGPPPVSWRPSQAAASPEPPAGRGKKISVETLSPLEKILYDKYGELGVRIYSLIDGEKTAEEILKETGVSEARLVEILEFMDEQGIIKLEKPAPEAGGEGGDKGGESEAADFEGKGSEAGAKGGEGGDNGGEKGEAESAREPRFRPMIEEEPEEKPYVALPPAPAKAEQKQEGKKEEEPEEDIIMVDVPAVASLSLMQKAVLFTELSTKFGKGARELVEMSDGKRDFVELSLSTGLSFFDIDAIMAYFGKKGFISFRVLSRDEIRDKYGEDGFAIYKRFGRDGLLLYQMIGKEASLRDIIAKSRVDVDRAIDIFVFIHKVLGLDIPLDRDMIYRQLGLKK